MDQHMWNNFLSSVDLLLPFKGIEIKQDAAKQSDNFADFLEIAKNI